MIGQQNLNLKDPASTFAGFRANSDIALSELLEPFERSLLMFAKLKFTLSYQSLVAVAASVNKFRSNMSTGSCSVQVARLCWSWPA